MTRSPEQRRRLEAVILAGVAAILFSIGLSGLWVGKGDDTLPERSGPVLPRLADDPGDVYTIEITTKQDRFVLQEDGERSWALLGRGSYPADADLATRLIARLAALEYDSARTSVVSRHGLLGLGDPENGGDGTRIVLRDFDGALLGDVIIGNRWGERGTYVRLPHDDQSWAANGVLPAMAALQDWLNLDFLALGPETIARAYVVPESGPPYFLERPGISERNFVLRAPTGWRLVSPGAGNGTATVLGRVRFRDVRAARFEERPIARYETETFSGLRLEVEIHEVDNARWAVIRAIALTDDAMGDALAINEQVDLRAFQISDLTEDRMIRPLSDIAVRTGG